MLHVIQLAVIGAVVLANIHWQVTPNGYLAAAAGVGAAYVVTLGISYVRELIKRRREDTILREYREDTNREVQELIRRHRDAVGRERRPC